MWKTTNEVGIVALVLATCVVLAGCGRDEGPSDQSGISRPVKTMIVGSGLGELRRRYPGEIQPYQEVAMAFQVSGPLVELPIQRGDLVEKGQLVAKIDPRDFQNELDATQAVLEEAQATYARYQEAAKAGAISQQQVAEQKAAVDVARSNRNIKQKALDDTAIYAPFAGRIADRFVENYENVPAKQPICSLQDIEELKIDFYVPEVDILTARKADRDQLRFLISFENLLGVEFGAKIEEFATDADPVTQTYRATLVMPTPKEVNALPGMTCQVTWVIPADSRGDDGAIQIPADAVLSPAEGQVKAWVINPDTMTVSARDVSLGTLAGKNIVVSKGLQAGEMIAVSGVHYLRDGMKVRSMSPAAQEPAQ